MTSILRRVVSGLFAHALGQIVNIAIQLLSFPIFLNFWSTAQYGTWLILSAIPSYLSMADIGMVTTAGNRMTMEVARGEIASANRVFQSTLVLIVAICAGLAILAVPYCLYGPLPNIATTDERIALAALVLAVLISPIGGLAEAIFRATGRYPKAANVATITRLAEWSGWIVGLWAFKSYSAVAIGGLLARIAVTALSILWANGPLHGIHWRTGEASKEETRGMLLPSLSFMSLPLANALSLQGITILVGHFFGANVVTIFSAFRTIGRVTVQITAMLSFAVWPEFSRLFGLGSYAAVRSVYLRAAYAGIIISTLLSGLIYLVSPWILKLWTHDLVEFQPLLMGIMLTYAAVIGASHVPRTFLMATNDHLSLAKWSMLAGLAQVLFTLVLGTYLGLEAIGGVMLAVEAVVAFLCVWSVHEKFAIAFAINAKVVE